MPSIRTFIAVVPSDRIRRNLANVISKLSPKSPAYRWVREDHLHLTIHFIGNLPNREIPEFCRAVADNLRATPPFELEIKGLGAFPTNTEPRVIWAGVEQGQAELKQLHQNLEPLLAHWGINKDRNRFEPHLTLGRLQKGERWNEALLQELQRLAVHPAGSCLIDKVIVYSSFPDRSGPTYTPMATLALRRRPT
jgi:2'-5' RNA ligase